MTQLPIPALLRPLSYIDFLAKSYLLACMAQPSARPVLSAARGPAAPAQDRNKERHTLFQSGQCLRRRCRRPGGLPTSPAWMMGSQPASAASASGRSRPWVSEIAPIVRIMASDRDRWLPHLRAAHSGTYWRGSAFTGRFALQARWRQSTIWTWRRPNDDTPGQHPR
jgi:hypothetical protein